jgi:hypothetical protein
MSDDDKVSSASPDDSFFSLADNLIQTSDRAKQQRLKEELARMTFGEQLPNDPNMECA